MFISSARYSLKGSTVVVCQLTQKQEAFCQEYVIDFNASQAAVRAGYSRRSAKQIGQENLTKDDIQTRLSDLSSKAVDRVGITLDDVLIEIKEIAFDRERDAAERLKGLEMLRKQFNLHAELDRQRIAETDPQAEHVVIYLPDNGRDPVGYNRRKILESEIPRQ